MTTPFTDGVVSTIRLGALIGIAISGFLLFRQMTGTLQSLGGCSEDVNCEYVFGSKWGSWMGIPVTGLVVGFYGGMFVLTLDPIRKKKKLIEILLGGMGVALLVASIWFVGLQLYHGVKCAFCMLAQLVGIVVGGIVVQSFGRAILYGLNVAAPQTAVVGVLIAAAFIGGQYIGKGYDLTEEEQQDFAEGAQRFDGTFYEFPNLGLSIERGKYPTLGNPNAEKAMVVMLDYSRLSGKAIHDHIGETLKIIKNDVAVIVIPVPLDGDCNPHWPAKDSANACQLASYAYAAWEVSPSTYQNYHDFLMGRSTKSGSLEGAVWDDENCNGRWDPGEKAIPGVKVDLFIPGTLDPRDRRSTDSSGKFVFGGLNYGLGSPKYQVRINGSNFDDGAALSGKINTFGFEEQKNRSAYFELTISNTTLLGKNFGYVSTDNYNKDLIEITAAEVDTQPVGSDVDDLELAELLRQAEDEADTALELLPDFDLMERTEAEKEADLSAENWQDSPSPVVQKLLDGISIYGEMSQKHRLPIVILEMIASTTNYLKNRRHSRGR